jgi:SAM-dependent methyltransferase
MAPAKKGDCLIFAPELEKKEPFFDEGFFKELLEVQEKNFWFRCRNQLIIWSLSQFFPQANSFFEIGCRTAPVLSEIEQARPELSLYGCDMNSTGLAYAARGLGKARLFQMDVCNLPFREEFDVIGAFDVLEHIQEDDLALSQMHKAVRKGGGIILTVPQHQFLWSGYDDYSGHLKRYSRAELKSKVEKAGFKILKMTSFIYLLFPLMILSRFLKRRPCDKTNFLSEYKRCNLFNPFFRAISDLELKLIQKGFHFPYGGSLLLVGVKHV